MQRDRVEFIPFFDSVKKHTFKPTNFNEAFLQQDSLGAYARFNSRHGTTYPAATAGLKRLAYICQELLEQAGLPNSVFPKDGEVPELMRSG